MCTMLAMVDRLIQISLLIILVNENTAKISHLLKYNLYSCLSLFSLPLLLSFNGSSAFLLPVYLRSIIAYAVTIKLRQSDHSSMSKCARFECSFAHPGSRNFVLGMQKYTTRDAYAGGQESFNASFKA